MLSALKGEIFRDEMPFLVEGELKSRLMMAFTAALPNAQEHLALAIASQEPLVRLTHACLTAFENAATMLANVSQMPDLSGNNPHDLDVGGQVTPLAMAIANTYGISPKLYSKYNPHCLDTLASLRDLSNQLHQLSFTS